jgi:hypothetical protein
MAEVGALTIRWQPLPLDTRPHSRSIAIARPAMCFAVQLNNFIKPWAATLKAAQTIAAVEHLDFNLFRVLIEMSLAETRSCTSGLGSRGPYQFVPPDSIAQAMHFCPGQNRTYPGHVPICPGRPLFQPGHNRTCV